MISFLPGVATEHVLDRLRNAGGNELDSGKLASPESSAALAVNCFGWFIDRPSLLPPFPGLQSSEVLKVDVEYQARFPWSGGRHPWLDAVALTSTQLIGIESKRFEPFRDQKQVSLSPAYDRDCWGVAMESFTRMRDALRSADVVFEHLDAAQLVKHAFGLITDMHRRTLKDVALVYLYVEPTRRGNGLISPETHARHRDEIARFGRAVDGAAVRFVAISYAEWIATWKGPDVGEHGRRLITRFEV